MAVPSEPAEIPFRYYALLVEWLGEDGVPPAALLQGTGVGLAALGDPVARIDFGALRRLVRNAASYRPLSELAFRLGQRTSLHTNGSLALAALHSPNLDAALRLIASHFRLVTPLLRLHYRQESEQGVLQLLPCRPLGELESFLKQVVFTSFYFQARLILGQPLHGVRASFTAPQPEARSEIADLPGIEFRFQAATDEIRLPLALLHQPLPQADPRAAAQALADCEAQLQRLQWPYWSERVRQRLLQDEDWPTIAQLAQRLGLNERTLRRRLDAEGRTYRQLVHALRIELASQWLQEGRPITAIALCLGYGDLANFTRAFRHATGRAPSQYGRLQ